ncbi:hypothetical protein [Parabacteroides pacaensis]|uniref:hypothetical protein n=1 Tax=Parabacteroides pacaensis TaxID=2086575 RepID=UPI000D10EBE5|nr:hypothetical protein [Parabacteroides pacaensis]
MKKNLIRVALFGALIFATGVSFVGCKDYDDDINDLQTKYDTLASSLEDLKTKVGDGVVKSVTYDEKTGVLTVVSSSGTVTYNTHQEIPTYDIKLVDNELLVDGKSVGKVTINASKVEVIDGVLFIDGKKTDITVPSPVEAGSKVEVKDDNYLYIDGKKTEIYVAPVITVEDGVLKINGVPQDLKLGLTEDNISFVKNADGTVIKGVNISINGESAFFKVQEATYVTSLTYIPENINEHLGNVAFFPVIAYDEWSTQNTHTKCFEYTVTNTPEFRTLYDGWLTMKYRVNPENVARDSYEILGFDNQKAYTTKSTAPGLKIGKDNIVKEANGDILTIKIQGMEMTKYGAANENEKVYDDPDGVAQSGKYAKQVDQLALRIQNKNAEEAAINNGIVTSEYVPVKRMVVEQQDVNIGINKDIDLENANPATKLYRDLSDMYPTKGHKFTYDAGDATTGAIITNVDPHTGNATYDNDINQYKIDIPVSLHVNFYDGANLENYLKNYADIFHTNTGYDAEEGQYLLEELGFEGLTRTYEVEGYKVGQVDQSTGADIYSQESVMKYLVLTADGKVSFNQENTASIDREPLIKVSLWTPNKTLVMSKLLKIKVKRIKQGPKTVEVDHIANQIVPCTDFTKASSEQTLGRYLDLDKTFNALTMSKEEFNNTYNPAKLGKAYSVTIKRNGAPVNDGTVAIDMTNFDNLGEATTLYNRLPLIVTTTALPGDYDIEIVFNTQSTEAKYNVVTLKDKFVLSYPETSLDAKEGMWAANYAYATIYVTDPEDKMEGILEDLFLKYNGTDCPEAKSTLHFELVTNTNGKVTITEGMDAYERPTHTIAIPNMADAPAWVDKEIEVRAYSTFNNLTDHTADCPVTELKSAKFKVKFVDPVAISGVETNWFLVDKAQKVNDPDLNKVYSTGHYVPVYRLFDIYDTHKTKETNGMIWAHNDADGWYTTPANVEQGVYLRDLHNVKVSYTLQHVENGEPINSNWVLARAKVNATTGELEWDNQTGEAVSAAGVVVKVKVTITYNWSPKSTYKIIEVPVKPAKTAFTMPTPGALEDGTDY